MIHGRGGNAEDILSLANHLEVNDFALLAPQATNHTWYPYSFLAPPEQNEPWLSSALTLLSELVNDVRTQLTQSEEKFRNATISLEAYNTAQKNYNTELAQLINLRLQQDIKKLELEKMIGVKLETVLRK